MALRKEIATKIKASNTPRCKRRVFLVSFHAWLPFLCRPSYARFLISQGGIRTFVPITLRYAQGTQPSGVCFTPPFPVFMTGKRSATGRVRRRRILAGAEMCPKHFMPVNKDSLDKPANKARREARLKGELIYKQNCSLFGREWNKPPFMAP